MNLAHDHARLFYQDKTEGRLGDAKKYLEDAVHRATGAYQSAKNHIKKRMNTNRMTDEQLDDRIRSILKEINESESDDQEDTDSEQEEPEITQNTRGKKKGPKIDELQFDSLKKMIHENPDLFTMLLADDPELFKKAEEEWRRQNRE